MKKKLNGILLVDDDYISCFLTEELIREKEFARHIYTVNDGKKALALIAEKSKSEEERVDLILLDINMPDMDGFEFLEKFERMADKQHISVVLLTTSGNYRDIEKAKQHNIYHYINKPLTEEKLLQVLNNSIRD